MEKENKYFNSDTENIKENTDTESLEDSEEEDDEDTEKTPVSEMSDSEIIKLCISGENEEPKTVSCLALAEFVGDDISKADNPDLYRDISSRIISNAQTGIEPHDEFTFVTMKFKSALDPELKLIWSLLQNYGRLDSSLNREKPVVFSLSMVPNGYAGDVMLVFSNPVIWTLEPEVVGIAANNIVKMVFPTDRFCIADGEDLEDIDIDAAEAEVRREMAVVRQEKQIKTGEKHEKKINMKKYKKTAVLFLMAALIGTEAGNINVQARELPEDIESVEDIVTTDAPFESKEDLFRENEMSTESGMSDMEPGTELDSAPEEVMDGSTINIRCYVDDIISEFEETIFFSVYNETTNKTYDFQLNAVNGYYDNVTLPMGECHIFASIRDNAGTYKLYTDTPAFTLTADPMELVCAYGTDSFIEKQKKIWDGLDVYSQSDTDELLKEAEVAAAGTEMIEETKTEAEMETKPDIREEIKPSAVSKKDSEKRNWPAIILATMMLIIVIVFLVRHIRRNENNPFFK